MNRRTFLKSFGYGLAAAASSLALSKMERAAAIQKTIHALSRTPQVETFDWHVDSLNGSSANDGRSPAAPFRYLSDLTGKPILPGHKVGLRRGSVFRETLKVPTPGASGSPITYAPYGSGAAPRILGSDALSGWTQDAIPGAAANILSESFSGTANLGFENTGWVTAHSGAGNIVDPNSTDLPRPEASPHLLKVQNAGSGFAFAVKILSAEQPVTFTNLSFYIDSEGLASGDTVTILRGYKSVDTVEQDVISAAINKNGTQLRLLLGQFNNGVMETRAVNIRAGRWYHIGLKYDYTNRTFERRINGLLLDPPGALTGTLRTGIQAVMLGNNGPAKPYTAHFSSIKISSSAFPAVTLPPGGWRASLNQQPRELFFVRGSQPTRYGAVQTAVAGCDAEFEWVYYNGYVVVYATANPAGLYQAVEASMRWNCIYHNTMQHIVIDGIEVAYSQHDTMDITSNWTVQHCESHHADHENIRTGAFYGGIYGRNVSNCVVQYCTIHNHPCKGVQFESSNNGVVSNNLIQHNVFYDNSDYSIDCQVFIGGGSNTGLVIQYNEFFTTNDWIENDTGASGIFTCGRDGRPMVGPIVRYNLFHDMGGNGVQVGPDVTQMQIVNNTFARTLEKYKIYTVEPYNYPSNAIFAAAAGSSWVVKNNIGYGFRYLMYIQDKNTTNSANVNNNCWFKDGPEPPYDYIFASGVTYRTGQLAQYRAGTGWDMQGMFANPLFVSPSDLRLQQGSPCIDAGQPLGIPFDYAGQPVKNPPEIGAYEFTLPAEIFLSNLAQPYEKNQPRPVSVSTNPPGLNVVLTYTGVNGTVYGPSPQPPVEVGAYQVDAVIDDPTYTGSATALLTIYVFQVFLPAVRR